jgi:hypothetical protein
LIALGGTEAEKGDGGTAAGALDTCDFRQVPLIGDASDFISR